MTCSAHVFKLCFFHIQAIGTWNRILVSLSTITYASRDFPSTNWEVNLVYLVTFSHQQVNKIEARDRNPSKWWFKPTAFKEQHIFYWSMWSAWLRTSPCCCWNIMETRCKSFKYIGYGKHNLSLHQLCSYKKWQSNCFIKNKGNMTALIIGFGIHRTQYQIPPWQV